MNCAEDVTIELADDGMIIRRPSSTDVEAECYAVRNAGQYTDRTDHRARPVPLPHLWLIWFGSLPLLAVLIYLSVLVFGS